MGLVKRYVLVLFLLPLYSTLSTYLKTFVATSEFSSGMLIETALSRAQGSIDLRRRWRGQMWILVKMGMKFEVEEVGVGG